MKKSNILLGCVADDFTGASDAASFLRSAGLRVTMCTGLPKDSTEIADCDAVVIALKCRSTPAAEAVRDCTEAFRWLLAVGAKQLYYKYCSTFDSTREGNIGPVMDAALSELGEKYTILCPALPVNGRTVKNGRLFVGGVPLHLTHMKDHPVNPMWASDISELMCEQSKYPCHVVTIEDMLAGQEHVESMLERFSTQSEHFYIIPDYFEQEHNELIYSLFGGVKILSGGSGLLAAVNPNCKKALADNVSCTAAGKSILLAGSCSSMTLRQITDYKADHSAIKIDPMKAIDGTQSSVSLWEEVAGRDGVLLYSSESAQEISRIPDALRPQVSAALEKLISELALMAEKDGYTQIIVAGGETSGAVAKALDFGAYLIGESVAPGVPVMMPVKKPELRLVLESGNFGREDFFHAALEMTTKGRRGI